MEIAFRMIDPDGVNSCETVEPELLELAPADGGGVDKLALPVRRTCESGSS